jgi:two-component system, LytTR family, response regulator
MKILIVDDEPLARERIREMLKKQTDIESIAEAANGGEAVKHIKTHQPDIVFLDIQMPDIDGFQVLEKLGEKTLSQIPAIIFVTAFDQHALRAFEFHALDYLLKPFDRDRFAETFRRAKAQINNRTDGDSNQRILSLLEQMNAAPEYLEWLTIKKDERIRLFKTEDIHWIEAQGNYVLLKFAENSELLRETMDGIETQLNPQIFIRIHRSAIININHIKELQVWRRGEYRVVMKGGKSFTLSRGYRSRFDAFLKKRLL